MFSISKARLIFAPIRWSLSSFSTNNVLNPFGDSNGVVFSFLNINSLKPKIEFIRSLLADSGPACLACSESWLERTDPDSAVALPGYNLERRDRYETVAGRQMRRGGGVIVYVREDIPYVRSCGDKDIDECVWLRLQPPWLQDVPVTLGYYYRSPRIRDGFFYRLQKTLRHRRFDRKVRRDVFIVAGDFNVNWHLPRSRTTRKMLQSAMNQLHLRQMIGSATRVTSSSTSLIDLVFVRPPSRVLEARVVPVDKTFSDHYVTSVLIGSHV